MPTVKRSEVREALKGRMRRFSIDRTRGIQRLHSAAIPEVPMTVLLGEETERFLDGLMEELEARLRVTNDVTFLD